MNAQHHLRRGVSVVVGHRFVTAVTRWPVESQQQARRNALVATTALAQRRAELDDVEQFLASRLGSPAPEVPVRAVRAAQG
jgi:hypothetical protein